MVLKILLALSISFAWAMDPKAYDKANEMAQKGHKEMALRLLELNYNLRSRDLPVKVATLATSLLNSLKRWHKAEQVADGALEKNWPGWQTKKLSKPSADFVALLKMSAEAKTQIFEANEEGRNREHLRSEIKLYTDHLGETKGNEGDAQQMLARVQTKAATEKAEVFHYDWNFFASYWSWEDRPTFNYQLAAKSKIFAPCFGLGVDYTNDMFHFAGGACGGGGSASMQFNTGTYDNRASVLLIAAYGSVLVRVSNSGAAFGLETDVMNLTTKGHLSDGTTESATNEEFALTAVGRYRAGNFDLKFKGGPVISNPSALWAFELGYVF